MLGGVQCPDLRTATSGEGAGNNAMKQCPDIKSVRDYEEGVGWALHWIHCDKLLSCESMHVVEAASAIS